MAIYYHNTTIELDLDEMAEIIKHKFYPEEVFGEEALEEWARDNGYILRGEEDDTDSETK